MKARVFPLAAACLLAITSRAAGQDVDWEAESLRGLDGLAVNVEDLPDPAQEGGLTKDVLQTYLEMRLREARIPVLSLEEISVSERTPVLSLEVLAIPTAAGGWAYALVLEVFQWACITGSDEGQEAPYASTRGCSPFRTWQAGGLYKTAEDGSPQSLYYAVRGKLAQFMDQLVNDYLAMNP